MSAESSRKAKTDDGANGGRVHAVERGLDVLETLGRSESELKLAEIGASLDLPRGTAHRLLGTLTSRGYARYDYRTRRYGLGARTLILASMSRQRLGPLARPFLEELVEVSGETCSLSCFDRDAAIYIEQAEPERSVRMLAEPGDRVPLHATATGKVLLAYQSRDLIQTFTKTPELPRFTVRTTTDAARLREELRRIRQQGYATDLGEYEEGVRSLAAPVFNPDGQILAAMSLSGPSSRLRAPRLNDLIPHAKSIAGTFSVNLDPFFV